MGDDVRGVRVIHRDRTLCVWEATFPHEAGCAIVVAHSESEAEWLVRKHPAASPSDGKQCTFTPLPEDFVIGLRPGVHLMGAVAP